MKPTHDNLKGTADGKDLNTEFQYYYIVLHKNNKMTGIMDSFHIKECWVCTFSVFNTSHSGDIKQHFAQA